MVTKLEGQIALSSCEILHIIGSLGKDDFFGIDDGYIDMDDIEINSAIAKAESTLIEKGYAELDFNGNFSVAKEVSDVLLICADCEKMLDIEISGMNKSKIKKTIYSKEHKLVEFETVGNSTYIITYCAIDDIKSTIFNNLNWIREKSAIPGRFFFTQKVLTDAKQTLGFGTEEHLVKECKNTDTAKVIANGLNGNSNYYSFTLFDFEKETIEINSLMILNSADGSLEMEPDGNNEGSSYAFKPIDYDTVKNRIEDTLTKLEGEVMFE